MHWGSDVFILENAFSWLYNCTLIPLLFQQEPQSQIHFFFSKATDKTNNPTYCYTFTPTGVAQETSYADYVGADRETRDFTYLVFLNIQRQEHI
jgi:hypothetical protein